MPQRLPFGEWIQAAKPRNPNVSDRDLANYYRETYGSGPNEDDYSAWAERAKAAVPDQKLDDAQLRSSYTRRFGDIEEVSDVKRALSSAWSETKAIGGGLVGLAGETVGAEGLRDWGLRTYEENMADVAAQQRDAYNIDKLIAEGDVGDWVDALQYHGVKGLTSLIGGLGTGLAVRTGARQVMKRRLGDMAEEELGKATIEQASKRGMVAGVGGYAVGQELGSIYPEAYAEAMRTGTEVDLAKVYGYGTAAGAVEGLSDVALLGLAGLGRMLPGGLRMAGFAPEGGRFTKAGKALGGAVLMEGAEEGLQNPLEYLGANKELGTEEFWAEQRQSMFAGAAGGLGGGGLVMLPHLLSPRAMPEVDVTPEKKPQGEVAPVSQQPVVDEDLAAAAALNQAIIEREMPDETGPVFRVSPKEAAATGQLRARSPREVVRESLIPADGKARVTVVPASKVSTQDLVDGLVDATNPGAGQRGASMKEAYEALSDEVTVDPVTQVERRLTMGESLHRRIFGVLPEVQKSDREVVLDKLSKEGLASATNSKNPNTPIKAVMDLHKELQALDTDTPEGAVAARDWFAQYDEKATKRNVNKMPKSAHAMDELVTKRKEELGFSGVPVLETPQAENIFSSSEAEAAFITLAHQLLDKTPGLTPKENAAVRLAFGMDVPGAVIPEGAREKSGQLSFRAVGKALATIPELGIKKGSQNLAKPLIEAAVVKISKASPEASTIMKTYMNQVRDIARRQQEDIADMDAAAKSMGQTVREEDIGTSEVDMTDIAEGDLAIGKGTSQVRLLEEGDMPLDTTLLSPRQASDRVRKEYLEEHKAGSIKELGKKEQAELKVLRKEAADSAQQAIDEAGAAYTAEQELLAERGVGTLEEVPLTDEEAVHKALIEEQQRVLAEVRAAANAELVAKRERTAQALWRVAVPELPWATVSVEEQESLYALVLEVESLPKDKQGLGHQAIVKELRNTYAGERAQPAERTVAEDRGDTTGGTAATDRETTADGEPVEGGEAVPEVVVGNRSLEGVKVQAKKRRTYQKPGEVSYGETAVSNPTTRESFERIVKNLIGRKSNWRLHIYATVDEAIAAGVDPTTLQGYSESRNKRLRTMGWVQTINGLRHATFILEHIQAGREAGTFMHEVGVHLGMESVLSPAQMRRLAQQIRQWARGEATSTEALVAQQAMVRARQAQVPEEKMDHELIAYFVEEAVNLGIDPTGTQEKGALARWFDTVWKAFQRAMHKLGLKTEDMTAQDFVDLAHGAAHIELTEPETVEMRGMESISYSEAVDPSIDTTEESKVQANINRLPEEFRPAVSAITRNIRAATQNVITGLSFLKDLGAYVQKKVPALEGPIQQFLSSINATKVDRATREKEITAVLDRLDALKLDVKKVVIKKASEYLIESRELALWGYQPAWKPGVVIDSGMAKKFDALPVEAQQVVMDVNRIMWENLQIKNQLINKRITDTFDARLAVAGTTQQRQAIQEEKDKALTAFGKVLAEVKGPYAPFKRHGKYVVQGYSMEMQKAKADKNWALVEKLRVDPKHYALEFAESATEAEIRKQELAKEFGHTDYWEKAQWRESPAVGLHEVDRLRSYIAGRVENESSDQAKILLNMAEDLALNVMSEEHARQSARFARGIRGYDKDMIRSFVGQARADAHYIANLKHLSETNDAVNQIASFVESDEQRSQTNLSRGELTRLANALYWHWGKAMDYHETPMLDRMSAVSSAWFLLFSPAYYIQNALQVTMMSVPWMAGRFGWTNAAREVGHAYADVKDMVLGAGLFEHFDTNKIADEEVRSVVRELLERGTIDITMDFELGRLAQTGTGPVAQMQRHFDQTVRRLPAKVETLNRVVTAIAAYRLSKNYPDAKYPGKSASKEHAVNYAAEVIDVTHGDYDGVNAPKFISPKFIPGAKVLFQFRKFQLIQLAYMARMLSDAVSGADANVKRVARQQLLFTLGHFGALAGGLGLPGMAFVQSTVAALGAMFGDDDEPWDSDAQIMKFRRAATEMGLSPEIIDILANGIPTALGMNLTSRLGAQNVVSLLPYIRADVREYDSYEKILAGALGPTASLGKRVLWGGMGQMAQGNYYKALESVLPNGLLKGTATVVRQATEGETTYNGDVVMTPDELRLWDALQTELGLSSPTTQRRFEKQRVLKSYESTFDQRTTDLKRQFVEAKRDGDMQAQRDLRKEWRNLQEAKRAAGFRVAPLGDLLKAPAAQAKRERQVEGGIKYDRGTRRFVEELSRVYGE